jgi:putative nucleotidyltransferase with HDIG domain
VFRALEARDPYTAGHQERVARLAVAIAREMGVPEDVVEAVRAAALVHHIGKLYIPGEIMSRPGKLSQPELDLIRTHARAGYEILQPIDFPWPVADIVLQHHERLDGSGYPQGLAGDTVMLEARILAVADVVEAMLSHRPYRPARAIEEAPRHPLRPRAHGRLPAPPGPNRARHPVHRSPLSGTGDPVQGARPPRDHARPRRRPGPLPPATAAAADGTCARRPRPKTAPAQDAPAHDCRGRRRARR